MLTRRGFLIFMGLAPAPARALSRPPVKDWAPMPSAGINKKAILRALRELPIARRLAFTEDNARKFCVSQWRPNFQPNAVLLPPQRLWRGYIRIRPIQSGSLPEQLMHGETPTDDSYPVYSDVIQRVEILPELWTDADTWYVAELPETGDLLTTLQTMIDSSDFRVAKARPYPRHNRA
jgi:hypothetical protein